MQQCGEVIYCCSPAVFIHKMLNLAVQARCVRIREYLSKCVRPINMGLCVSKEYDSIWKHFVVVSDITAITAKSHLSIKKTKTHREMKESQHLKD